MEINKASKRMLDNVKTNAEMSSLNLTSKRMPKC